MPDGTISTFRTNRGRILTGVIKQLAVSQHRPITVLDVGGRRDYWKNVGFEGIGKIVLLNIDPADLGRATEREDLFVDRLGDACDLSEVENHSFDFYHSNSVIEHVGGWSSMKRMAVEADRVAKAGWVQTPAWEFPIEPHFRLPFMHWLSAPTRAAMLKMSPSYHNDNRECRRLHAERINLLSRADVKSLFPGGKIMIERYMLLPKSYVVQW